jgi:hypothetical protein
MKLIIRNGENITLEEAVGLAGRFFVSTRIINLKFDKRGMSPIFVVDSVTGDFRDVFWLDKNKASITFSVRRDFKEEVYLYDNRQVRRLGL